MAFNAWFSNLVRISKMTFMGIRALSAMGFTSFFLDFVDRTKLNGDMVWLEGEIKRVLRGFGSESLFAKTEII
jgi:hypothetical protein